MTLWWNQNWGNVASVLGLVVGMISLYYSYWAFREAQSAEEMVSRWQRRRKLEGVRDAVFRAEGIGRRLRDTRATKWPKGLRLGLRDELARAQTGFAGSYELLERLDPIIAELRNEIPSNRQTAAYLESIMDIVLRCEVEINRRMEEA